MGLAWMMASELAAVAETQGRGIQPGESGEMRCRVERGNAVAADGFRPLVHGQFVSVLAINGLPDFHFGCFCIEDQSVEIKDEGLQRHVIPWVWIGWRKYINVVFTLERSVT